MTFDEIDARYRAAVLTASGDGDGWDDPETDDEDDEPADDADDREETDE